MFFFRSIKSWIHQYHTHLFNPPHPHQKAIKSLEFYRNIRSHDDRGLVDFDGEMDKLKTADLNGDTEIRVQLTVHDFSE